MPAFAGRLRDWRAFCPSGLQMRGGTVSQYAVERTRADIERSAQMPAVAQRGIRVGIVGANANGSWANVSHVPAINGLPGLKLAAVATRNEQSARKAALVFGADRWFSDSTRTSQRPSHRGCKARRRTRRTAESLLMHARCRRNYTMRAMVFERYGDPDVMGLRRPADCDDATPSENIGLQRGRCRLRLRRLGGGLEFERRRRLTRRGGTPVSRLEIEEGCP